MSERRTKYGNAQTIQGGVVYHSRLEAEVARVLDLLVRQGRVQGYERQIPLELAPHRGRERSVVYKADFAVHCAQASGLIEAKGFMTEGGRLKLRWLREKYPQVRLWVVHEPQEVIAVIEALEQEVCREGGNRRSQTNV